MASLYHLIIYSPLEAADKIRKAAADAGAGKIGLYDSCSFSSKGTGKFRPMKGAKPAIGSVGEPEMVEEERIEFVVTEDTISDVITAIKNVHPYEEPAIHVLPMEDYKQWLTN